MNKYNLFILFLFFIFVSCTSSQQGQNRSLSSSSQPVVRYEYGLPIDSFTIDTNVVKRGETLGGMLVRAGATPQQIALVSRLPRETFDVRQIREGKTYLTLNRVDTIGQKRLCHLVYKPSIQESVVLHLTDSFYVESFRKPIQTVSKYADAVIETSLWNAMTSRGLPVELALELSEIYAWTIDFFGLQKNDSIQVYYDEQFVDSVRVGIGRIYAANFYHGGKWHEAFFFDGHYYDRAGNSLKKAFLKAPLNYKRISSHFSYARKHPIYKTVRPHTGVDYAAPAGTPVVAIGDGTVIMKEYKGGGGNTVKIKHNSTYTTAYLHLQGYAKGLKVGQRVQQGQLIGYVGSTGSSTGPHLDFRIWKNGTPIDPLKMVSPPAEPISNSQRQDFDSTVVVLQQHLQR